MIAINRRAWVVLAMLMSGSPFVSASQGPGPGPGGPEVLSRGPIHEAFASPIVFNPTPGVVVPKPPPQTAIEEQPPAEKPEGADVEWVSGYWSFDDERQDYIWISGIWRDIPPGRQWVPGYWSQAPGGFQWTSGFWAPTAAAGPVSYLPAPPQSLEVGPNTPAPGPNFAWAPGCWLWVDNRYVWRPGTWIASQPNWMWVPGNYIATPGGYVYNGGYWDYNLAQRGVPFAPVAFGPGFSGQQSYAYTPGVTLAIGGLLGSLFVRPSYGQYYFGDYYGPVGQGPRAGYYPWFEYRNRVGYDPIYASMSARNGGQPGWDRVYREEYITRVQNVNARPPATYAAQRNWIDQRQARGENVRGMALAQPLNQWSGQHPETRPLVRVNDDHRAELNRRQASIQEFSQNRARQETQARMPANVRPEEHRPQQIEMPRSPVRAASEPRFQSRGIAQPPPHPQPHPANFGPAQGHREPAPPERRNETRPKPEERPHAEPGKGREAEHERPGKPK